MSKRNNMKKKINNINKNTTVLVNFHPATDKEINKLLNSLNITGIKVSNLIPRWALEVPFWKEKYYIEKLSDSELVEKVYSNPMSKKTNFSEVEDD
jgi:hypothetical protein